MEKDKKIVIIHAISLVVSFWGFNCKEKTLPIGGSIKISSLIFLFGGSISLVV